MTWNRLEPRFRGISWTSGFTRRAFCEAIDRLRVQELERRHREGYLRKPARRRSEFDAWDSEQVLARLMRCSEIRWLWNPTEAIVNGNKVDFEVTYDASDRVERVVPLRN